MLTKNPPHKLSRFLKGSFITIIVCGAIVAALPFISDAKAEYDYGQSYSGASGYAKTSKDYNPHVKLVIKNNKDALDAVDNAFKIKRVYSETFLLPANDDGELKNLESYTPDLLHSYTTTSRVYLNGSSSGENAVELYANFYEKQGYTIDHSTNHFMMGKRFVAESSSAFTPDEEPKDVVIVTWHDEKGEGSYLSVWTIAPYYPLSSLPVLSGPHKNSELDKEIQKDFSEPSKNHPCKPNLSNGRWLSEYGKGCDK